MTGESSFQEVVVLETPVVWIEERPEAQRWRQ